jgi:hypothetical protein
MLDAPHRKADDMKKRTVLLALALLSLAPAAVAGTITGVTLNPISGPLPLTVSATVNGTGSCDTFHFSWGDGSPVLLMVHSFPATITPHKYTTQGSYTVTVSPGSNCTGQVTANVGAGQKLGDPPKPAITGLKITQPVPPAAAKVGDTVRVTVEGYGTCNFFLGWGDNAFPADPFHHPLPMPGTGHTYAKAGKFVIRAWDVPPGPCGKASATIVVNWPFVIGFPTIERICQLVPCVLPEKPGEEQEKLVKRVLALNEEFQRAAPGRRKQIEQEAEKLLVQAQGMRR